MISPLNCLNHCVQFYQVAVSLGLSGVYRSSDVQVSLVEDSSGVSVCRMGEECGCVRVWVSGEDG